MGWGFRKSFKIAPGVRVNVSKKGISTSLGMKGFTINSRGKVTTSIPGTGIRHTTSLSSGSKSSTRKTSMTGHLNMAQGKRAAENESFAATLWERRRDAVSSYFLSHGILVDTDDIDQALTFSPHSGVFAGLNIEFSETTEALQLLQDIGSLSLAAKEKAMRALYAIENSLAAVRGSVSGIAAGLQELNVATQSIPQKPKFWAYVVWTIITTMFALASPPLGFFPLIVLCTGLYKKSQYKRKLAISTEALTKANAILDSLLQHELTPRAHFLS